MGDELLRRSGSRRAVRVSCEALERRVFMDAAAPDASFHGDGVLHVDHRNLSGDRGQAVLVQPDGKIVVGGWADIPGISPTARGALARYHPDGSLDLSFGDDGKASAGIGYTTSIARLPDGRLIAFGRDPVHGIPTLTRVTAAGVLDTSFGAGGNLMLGVPFSRVHWSEFGGGVAVSPDGALVVASARGGDGLVQRYSADGVLDTAFGTNGEVVIDVGPFSAGTLDTLYGPIVTADGKVTLAFAATDSSGVSTAGWVRLLGNGSRDGTFGWNGTSQSRGVGTARPRAAARGADGSLALLIDRPDVTVARWTAAGLVAGGFGTGGMATVSRATADETGYAIAVQDDGRILVGGSDGADAFVLRLTTGGTPDTTFGAAGWRLADFGGPRRSSPYDADGVHALTVRDGKVIAAGTAIYTQLAHLNTTDFAALRLAQSNGQPDATFGGGDGVVVTSNFRSQDDRGLRAFALAGGKLLVASASNGWDHPHSLARLNPDGSFDRTFADGGRVVSRDALQDRTYDFDVRNDKIVVLGGGYLQTPEEERVWRLNADGSTDASFGDGGDGTAPVPGLWRPLDVEVMPDDRVVVLGEMTGNAYAVFRYTAAGQPDPMFGGGDGIAHVLNARFVQGTTAALHVAGDGAVTIAGATAPASGVAGQADFAVTRLRPDGTPDPAFGGAAAAAPGLARIAGPAGSTFGAFDTVAVDAAGRILAAGYHRLPGAAAGAPPSDVPTVVRLTPGGAPDPAFGGGDGLAVVPFEGPSGYARAVALHADGRIVVAGNAGTVMLRSDGTTFLAGSDPAAAQLRPDGTPDPLFGGGDGGARFGTAAEGETFNDAIVLPDGRVVLTGTAPQPARGTDVLVVRLAGATFVPPPRVAGVFVSGTAWSASLLDHLRQASPGQSAPGYALSAADPLNELPWTNVNKVSVRFSGNVNAAPGSLTVAGARVGRYGVGGVTYDAGTFTATWTLNTAGVGNDKLALSLSGVTDPATGAGLDGEWPGATPGAFPSGDGTAGGAFRFRLNVLPGDVDRNGSVSAADMNLVKLAQGAAAGTSRYSVFKDVNGSGAVMANDVTLVRGKQGTKLPGGEPMAAAVASNTALVTNANGGGVPTAGPNPGESPVPARPRGFSVDDVSRSEGMSGTTALTFTVTLTQPAGTGGASVRYRTQNHTAGSGDYNGKPGLLSFAPGQTSKTVSVTLKADTKKEVDEAFRLELFDAVGAAIGDSTGVGTIRNDD